MANKHANDSADEAPESPASSGHPGNPGNNVTTDSPNGPADAESNREQFQRERDDLYDRLLRKTAEFDNYRKRIDRERREQADQAVTDLVLELLSVVDDFDRALTVDAGPNDGGAYRKGVEIIHAKLQDLLKKYGVRPFDALGEDFDPNLHQAVVHEVSPDHREGQVIGELQRGYKIGDRLLRPAMVKVAKA
jgi:molecular chaperone GrpE